MKCSMGNKMMIRPQVAPFTGAWIEIQDAVVDLYLDIVAPFTGAWIEIDL